MTTQELLNHIADRIITLMDKAAEASRWIEQLRRENEDLRTRISRIESRQENK
jgi:hypothetical protein